MKYLFLGWGIASVMGAILVKVLEKIPSDLPPILLLFGFVFLGIAAILHEVKEK